MIPFINMKPEEMGVLDSMFVHKSSIHGQAHVNRVIFHSLHLCKLLHVTDFMLPMAWAAAYLHDLYREHDGACDKHGVNAAAFIGNYRDLFLRAGVQDYQFAPIRMAVRQHCWPDERLELVEKTDDANAPMLCKILKDADALDRCRLGDLDVNMLRFSATKNMVTFANNLYRMTDGGKGDFISIYEVAMELYYGT